MKIKFDYKGFKEYIPFTPDNSNIEQFKPNIIFNFKNHGVLIDFNCPLTATIEQHKMFEFYMLYFKGLFIDIFDKFQCQLMDEITKHRIISIIYEFEEYCEYNRFPSIQNVFNHCYGIKPYLPFTIG